MAKKSTTEAIREYLDMLNAKGANPVTETAKPTPVQKATAPVNKAKAPAKKQKINESIAPMDESIEPIDRFGNMSPGRRHTLEAMKQYDPEAYKRIMKWD
jgi:hypothetical protein